MLRWHHTIKEETARDAYDHEWSSLRARSLRRRHLNFEQEHEPHVGSPGQLS